MADLVHLHPVVGTTGDTAGANTGIVLVGGVELGDPVHVPSDVAADGEALLLGGDENLVDLEFNTRIGHRSDVAVEVVGEVREGCNLNI